MDPKDKYKLYLPPVFVCGVQRSGTTLLVKMLSKHPEIEFLPQETHYYPLFWKPGDNLNRFGGPAAFSEILMTALPKVNFGWTRAEGFLQELSKAVYHLDSLPMTTSELMRFTMHLWQELQQTRIRTGEKTPAHVYYALEILKEFPDCKIIVMCRDPRAAALSELVKLEGNERVNREFSAFNFIARWLTAVTLSERLAQTKRALFIRYEDMISDPADTLKKVTSHLDIDLIPEMLDVGVTNSSFSDRKQEGIGFNTENLDRWKSELNPGVISLIEYHLGDKMQRLGYMPGGITTDISGYPLLKQRAKLAVANSISKHYPARFHHYNRNRKYRL